MKVIGRMRPTVGGVADRKPEAVTVPLRVVTGLCELSLFRHTIWQFCNAARRARPTRWSEPDVLLRDDPRPAKFIPHADDTRSAHWEHAPM
jgi:hypothetical protein